MTPTPVFDQVCGPAVLGASFERRLPAPGLWMPGVHMDAVRRRPARHLLALRDDLAAGTYRPSPGRSFDVAKADGSTRRLVAFCSRDVVVQQACQTVLRPLAERWFLDCSYGFRPGLSVAMACARVREWVREGYHWLLDADIERCFDAVGHRHALAILSALCADSRVVGLVRAWLNPEGLDSVPNGLPQGMVLSPLLCNLVLHRLDLAMQRIGIPMVRYADDFVCFARRREDAHIAWARAAQCLSLSGLALHPAKTRVVECNRRLRFLGQPLPRLAIARRWAAHPPL